MIDLERRLHPARGARYGADRRRLRRRLVRGARHLRRRWRASPSCARGSPTRSTARPGSTSGAPTDAPPAARGPRRRLPPARCHPLPRLYRLPAGGAPARPSASPATSADSRAPHPRPALAPPALCAGAAPIQAGTIRVGSHDPPCASAGLYLLLRNGAPSPTDRGESAMGDAAGHRADLQKAQGTPERSRPRDPDPR